MIGIIKAVILKMEVACFTRDIVPKSRTLIYYICLLPDNILSYLNYHHQCAWNSCQDIFQQQYFYVYAFPTNHIIFLIIINLLEMSIGNGTQMLCSHIGPSSISWKRKYCRHNFDAKRWKIHFTVFILFISLSWPVL